MEAQTIKSTKDDFEVIVIKLADSKTPEFKESKSKDYVRYGKDNNYGNYLLGLFNKSAKHNAIINGKAFYIFGLGFGQYGNIIVNRLGETLDDIAKKCILDVEVFGGYRLEFIYNLMGKICEIYHVGFNSIRTDKDSGFWYKEECWTTYDNGYDATFINEYNPYLKFGSQIFAYDEYRPDTKFYPLPAYVAATNYISTDIEISKYYLSSISNGMTPSKMIQFFDGEPDEEKKSQIEKRFKDKFAGSENAGNIILVFGKNKDKSVQIDDLSATELDKQFIEMNKTCQQEIFSGHLVTSPMLFGIKTEGQLGGNTELSISYSIFQNTYAKPKARTISKDFTSFLKNSIWPVEANLQPINPIGIQFDIKDIIASLPKQFIYETLEIPEKYWNLETVNPGAPGLPAPQQPVKTAENSEEPKAAVNDNIKNLSAKQHQQLLRIIRQYSKGILTQDQAKTLLQTGLGLSDDEINKLLGIKTVMSSQTDDDMTDDEAIEIFDNYGDVKSDYEILKSKKVLFSSNEEAFADEETYIKEAFAEYDVTITESKILDLIEKDSLITPEVIAKTIGQSVKIVQNKIDSLKKRGYIIESENSSGQIERTVSEDIKKPNAKIDDKPLSKISIKYSYEGPKDSKNRPFCRKLLELDRLYTRAEIELISEKLGYSVFDRKGGFWRHSDGTITPYCRHNWKSNIVIKK